MRSTFRNPTAAYVAPFAVFLLLLVLWPQIGLGAWEEPLRLILLTFTVWYFSRGVLDWRLANVAGSVLVGVGVFVVWIGPDILVEGYRQHWLFENSVTGAAGSSLSGAARADTLFLVLRSLRAAVVVPVIEELFWRGWLMRWIISSDFERVPLGTYAARAFWITALLFASEHGPYWEVGLAAGIVYNWWMVRTKRLGDCVLAHAVTNAALSAYVIGAGKWEYWM